MWVRQKLGLKPGDAVLLEETSEGFLIKPGEKLDPQSRFRKMLDEPPRRRGRPENPSPEEMKGIWLGQT